MNRVWSVGGMILTGETEVLGKKPVSMTRHSPQIPHGVAAMKGRRPTA
jgi:hypothetical protein